MSKVSLFADADERIEQRVKHGTGGAVPPIPGKCSARGCAHDTVLAFAAVMVDGKRRVGAASDYLTAERKPREGVTWLHWITRCSGCYSAEASRNARSEAQI